MIIIITIFNTGEYNYQDLGIDKPVKYSVNNLIEIASRTGTINVTKEHTDEVIGEMSNFIVKDGLLMANEPNNLDFKGKGFSPVFNYDLIDRGEYYEPTNIKMNEVGLCEKPRNKIVYNSIKTIPNGENVMSDTEIQKLVKRNNELQEEIGVLKNTNKQLNKAIKDKDKEIKEIKDSYSDVDKKVAEYDGLKDIETKYNSLISSKKDDLIHQIVGEDKEMAKRLQSWSIEDLELQKELFESRGESKGITPSQSEVDLDDGNIPTPDDDGNDLSSDEMVEFYEDTFGEKPSFINE